MPDTQPHLRESGSGPSVVCIHSNASTSAQWRGLMDLFSPSHRVLAPDSYGAGKSIDWPSKEHNMSCTCSMPVDPETWQVLATTTAS